MTSLTGKQVFVTGGARGLGQAIVTEMAALGAVVHFTCTTQASLQSSMQTFVPSAQISGTVCDLRDREHMTSLLAQGWDILINNASIATPVGPFHEADEHAWLDALNVNLGAAVSNARAVIGPMLATGGTIINISSGAAIRPIPNSSAYCVSKAGLAMLTQMLHAEYGRRNIRVFGFSPGVMRTDMHSIVRKTGYYDGAFPPLDDIDGPEKAALVVAWLSTSTADTFIGRELSIHDKDLLAAMRMVK